MMRIRTLLLALSMGSIGIHAQVFETAVADGGCLMSDGGCLMSDGKASEDVVVADGFWKNCFVQVGLDMTLQNPYGYDFSKVFPNGKSF